MIFNNKHHHICHPLPIEGSGKDYEYRAQREYAVYDKYEIIYKLSQCPVCKCIYGYDYSAPVKVGEMSIKEAKAVSRAHRRG